MVQEGATCTPALSQHTTVIREGNTEQFTTCLLQILGNMALCSFLQIESAVLQLCIKHTQHRVLGVL